MLGSEAQPPDELACPLLGLAGDSRTRYRFPSGEHRCYAVAPPLSLTQSYQARYCLTADYPTCERYKAWQARPSRAPAAAASLADLHRQAPPDPNLRRATIVRSRRLSGAPLLSVVVIGVAIVALTAFVTPGWLVGAGATPTAPGSGLVDAGSPSPTPPTATSTPTPTPTSQPTPQPTPTIEPSPTRSPEPTPTPSFSHTITYVVVPGDTLKAIAARYGVTVQSIVDANQLSDPNFIRSGQTLLIPQP